MTEQRRHEATNDRLSRLLSRLLRHSADQDGVRMSDDGWVSMRDALAWVNRNQRGSQHQRTQKFTEANVIAVITDCPKQRFGMRRGAVGIDIRANQGHSICVAIGMDELTSRIGASFCVGRRRIRALLQSVGNLDY